MAPAIAYFLLLGLSMISNRFSFKFKNRNITFAALALIFTSLILFSTITSIPAIKIENQDYKISNEQIATAVNGLQIMIQIIKIKSSIPIYGHILPGHLRLISK